jgi:prolyl-tRNA synthetase
MARDERSVTPQSEDFSAWYNDVVFRAELVDRGPVRGSMVIRPYGYRIWELLQADLDGRIKATGHQNAYFPLLIPQSYMEREAEHVEGFAPELFTVTHAGGKELEEPLVIRPTSETIIGEMMAKWINSHRDLPLLLNQWANVLRWEMRPRMFLRTSEFLWQEGHTAHATAADATAETMLALGFYQDVAVGTAALATVPGEKTPGERFAGAERTFTLEGMMRDGRALQAGTSHFMGTNFAAAFGITYTSESGTAELCHTTSWGMTTRMIGALIMTHGDDKGLRCPPRLAPIELVIVPIYKTDEERARVLEVADKLKASLAQWERRAPGRLRIEIDAREGVKPGAKYYHWELRGVPLRMELGPRDIDKGQCVLVRRDTGEKASVSLLAIGEEVHDRLVAIQDDMLIAARERREQNSVRHQISYDDFRALMDGAGAFVYAGWCGSAECEAAVKEETKATIRCLPDEEFRSAVAPTTCLRCGKASKEEALWARAY